MKGRTVLSMESTLARMNRLGSSVLMDVPILSLDELLAKIDAVTAEDVAELAREHLRPGPDVGGRRGPRRDRLPRGARRRGAGCGVISVAVSGAAGRMGQTVCAAVEGAEDMS